jgi:hypothetical protein
MKINNFLKPFNPFDETFWKSFMRGNGFEPLNALSGQILSLVGLTTPQPAHNNLLVS